MKHITLRILCEGQTESNFALRALKPHLQGRNVFVKAEPLRDGQYGIVDWNLLRRNIKADVGRSREHEYVTTMIDLYRIGNYPGCERRTNETVYDRVARIENKMRAGLPNSRFLPYVSVHEFEALLLVDPSVLRAQFPDGEADAAPKQLARPIGGADPELVDDKSPPSLRIIDCVPSYRYLKSVAGPAAAAAIGIHRLRKACPHFGEWINRLESLSADVNS